MLSHVESSLATNAVFTNGLIGRESIRWPLLIRRQWKKSCN